MSTWEKITGVLFTITAVASLFTTLVSTSKKRMQRAEEWIDYHDSYIRELVRRQGVLEDALWREGMLVRVEGESTKGGEEEVPGEEEGRSAWD